VSGARRPQQYLKPGTAVNRFRIIRKIAVGGMGVVYEARDMELGRSVALKHPRLDIGDPEISRQRFLREARAASLLLHPNIVPIFEVFETEGLPWLAMELVIGLLCDRGGRPLSIEVFPGNTSDTKTGHLEMRPLFLRNAERTRGHALVVMLAYRIVQELADCWAPFDFTVEEAAEPLQEFRSHCVH